MPYKSFYYRVNEERLWRRFLEICKREGRSGSQVILKLMFQYVQEHEKGNPQALLAPQKPRDYQVEAFPLERRRENMEWLKSLIARNPGHPDLIWVHKFSELTGLKTKTVQEYLRTLLILKEVVRQGGKLYARDQVSP